MKPNKLPKHSLSPFLEVTRNPTPYTTLVTSRAKQNEQLTWAWAGALHYTLPLGSGLPASARRPSSPTHTGLTHHLPSLARPFPPFQVTLHPDSSWCRKVLAYPQGPAVMLPPQGLWLCCSLSSRQNSETHSPLGSIFGGLF